MKKIGKYMQHPFQFAGYIIQKHNNSDIRYKRNGKRTERNKSENAWPNRMRLVNSKTDQFKRDVNSTYKSATNLKHKNYERGFSTY